MLLSFFMFCAPWSHPPQSYCSEFPPQRIYPSSVRVLSATHALARWTGMECFPRDHEKASQSFELVTHAETEWLPDSMNLAPFNPQKPSITKKQKATGHQKEHHCKNIEDSILCTKKHVPICSQWRHSPAGKLFDPFPPSEFVRTQSFWAMRSRAAGPVEAEPLTSGYWDYRYWMDMQPSTPWAAPVWSPCFQPFASCVYFLLS